MFILLCLAATKQHSSI